jgi:hypothetical protein
MQWWWNNSLRGNQYGYPTPEEKPGRPPTIEGKLSPEELEANRTVAPDAVVVHKFVDDEYNGPRVYDVKDVETPLLSVANWVCARTPLV